MLMKNFHVTFLGLFFFLFFFLHSFSDDTEDIKILLISSPFWSFVNNNKKKQVFNVMLEDWNHTV